MARIVNVPIGRRASANWPIGERSRRPPAMLAGRRNVNVPIGHARIGQLAHPAGSRPAPPRVPSPAMDAAPARIALYLDQIGAEAERRGEREWGVRLPSAKRGAVGALLTVRERTLTIRAFVLRGPDRTPRGRLPAAAAQEPDDGPVAVRDRRPRGRLPALRRPPRRARRRRARRAAGRALLGRGRGLRERGADRVRRARGHGVPPPAGGRGLGGGRYSIPVPKHSASR